MQTYLKRTKCSGNRKVGIQGSRVTNPTSECDPCANQIHGLTTTESGKGMSTGRAATTPAQRFGTITIDGGREGTGR